MGDLFYLVGINKLWARLFLLVFAWYFYWYLHDNNNTNIWNCVFASKIHFFVILPSKYEDKHNFTSTRWATLYRKASSKCSNTYLFSLSNIDGQLDIKTFQDIQVTQLVRHLVTKVTESKR